MRQRVIGWFYGLDGGDSCSLRLTKASVSMFLVYSIGVLSYILFLHGFMDYSWLTLGSILFPTFTSLIAGVDVFLANPEMKRYRAAFPDKFFFHISLIAVSLFLEWLVASLLLFRSLVIM